MKRLLAIAALASLVACSPPATDPVPTNPAPEPASVAQVSDTETKHHFDPGTDPRWAQAVYDRCEELTTTVSAYNTCLEDMAEYD